MTVHFRDSKNFTLGVELELQLVDRATLELTQKSTEVLELLKDRGKSFKPELMLSNLEVISRVCPDLVAAEADLKKKVATAMEAAAARGVILCSASTHPFSRWRDQKVTDDPRYRRLLDSLQMVARRFNIFGLHVHVGVAGGDRCIFIMKNLLYYMPHLLAISTNSPFWQGEDSGLKSYRTKVFESLPTAGLPFYFHDWSDYTRLVRNYLETHTIESIRELWWDIRPHPDFGTIEVRICDIPTTIGETISIAALIQAMVARFSADYDAGVAFERPHSAIIRENKWRAARYGLEGEFILEDGSACVPAKKAVEMLLDSVEPHALAFGSSEYLGGIADILDRGTGADRQLEVWKETGDLRAVVEDVHRRFAEDVGSGGRDGGEEGCG